MTESSLLPRKRCDELTFAVQQAAARMGVPDVEVLLTSSAESLTRFANNEIHQNVSERTTNLSVRTQFDGRTARASTNRLNRDGIENVVEQAIALTRASEPYPDLLPLYEDATAADGSHYSDAAARCSPEARAAAVAEAIRVVESQNQIAAGIYATGEHVEALLNTRGLSRYYFGTMTQFSITAMAEDSSGWAKASSPAHEDVQPVALAQRAAKKAAQSRNPQLAEPGHYTVVLEPAAVLDLVGQIFGDFSGTSLADKRSFLNERIGEKLFGSNITIYDDVHFPLQSGTPFDGEGVPRRPLALVKAGVPSEVAYSRAAAAKAGVDPTGHGFPLPNEHGEAPHNIVIAGGSASLDELVQSTVHGILVTRLWYIREVEPFEKVMTGMTRDGTFLIRNGEIAAGLRNFRFNQSVVEMLRNVEALSASERATGEEAFDMVVPAMKVHNFQFTEVTRF
jgi:predicted Zn-dependent protease